MAAEIAFFKPYVIYGNTLIPGLFRLYERIAAANTNSVAVAQTDESVLIVARANILVFCNRTGGAVAGTETVNVCPLLNGNSITLHGLPAGATIAWRLMV